MHHSTCAIWDEYVTEQAHQREIDTVGGEDEDPAVQRERARKRCRKTNDARANHPRDTSSIIAPQGGPTLPQVGKISSTSKI